MILLRIHIKLVRFRDDDNAMFDFLHVPMTFLNPFVLIGLAAASIPILLHLFNLRKLQKIEFSTLTFLKELQKTKIRRLKLRQLLLLFLRTMIVVLVVTAF